MSDAIKVTISLDRESFEILQRQPRAFNFSAFVRGCVQEKLGKGALPPAPADQGGP